MAERPVKFVITVEDGADAAGHFEEIEEAQRGVTQSTREMAQAQDRATRVQTAQAVASLDARQKLEQLGSTIGQVGATLARINPQFSRLGGVIGSVGAQIPALTGSLGPIAQAMAAVTIAVDLGSQAWELWTGDVQAAGAAADRTKRQVTDLANSLTQLHERQAAIAGRGAIAPLVARFEELDEIASSRRLVFDNELADAERFRIRAEGRIATLRQEQRDNAGRIAAINAQGGIQAVDEAGIAIERIERSVRRANDRVRNLHESARSAQAQFREAEEALVRARARPGVGDPAFPELEAPDSGGGGQRAGAQREVALRAEVETRKIEAEGIRFLAGLREAERQTRLQQGIETELQIGQIAAQEEMNRLAALNRIGEARQLAHEEQLLRLEEARETERQAAAELQADLQATLTPIVDSTAKALASIISGAESAEDAFANLLASFLEMIAQQAALEAVKEFAAALGKFASQDYVSGALHLAAGGAWVAVAALAGGASAAVAPSQPAAPTSPETGPDSATVQGGTVVYNFNAPIISTEGSSDRALAGREIGVLVSEGDNRFGRAS